MNDPSETKTLAYEKVVRTIREYNELLEHARFITDVDNEFAKLEITSSGHIRVAWPEPYEDHGFAEIHTEVRMIEPTLFLKSRVVIEDIWAAEQEEEDRLELQKRQRLTTLKAKMAENSERAEYARLKTKYGE